jgi:hypothetical protein
LVLVIVNAYSSQQILQRLRKGQHWCSCNILLIDDDEITLELLRHTLEIFISGEISCFSSSTKALEFIQSGAQTMWIWCCAIG